MTEVHILIHENALEEMMLREARMIRQMRRLQEDLDALGNDIRAKRFETQSLRDMFLSRGCV